MHLIALRRMIVKVGTDLGEISVIGKFVGNLRNINGELDLNIR